jgi:hypothetical protein
MISWEFLFLVDESLKSLKVQNIVMGLNLTDILNFYLFIKILIIQIPVNFPQSIKSLAKVKATS